MKSLTFKAEAHAKSGILNKWTSKSDNNELPIAIPESFKGPGQDLSPEDLYVQALINCLIGTFKVYAENSKLHFENINVIADLKMDYDSSKAMIMKSCHFEIKLQTVSNPEKANLLIKKTFQNGFILNSVKTELTYNLNIHN